MIQALLGHPMQGVELHHVRMAYSKGMLDIGKPGVVKVLHLLGVVARSAAAIIRRRPDIVYYPPGGPNRAPVLRDVATLFALRPISRRLVLHFHAAGTSQVWERGLRPRPLAWAFRRAFFGADAAIVQARTNPPDGQVLQARRVYYIPNGIPDESPGWDEAIAARAAPHELRLLFVGVMLESKGVLDLARATRSLWDRGVQFRVVFVGDHSPEMRSRLLDEVGPHAGRVEFRGVLSGREKWEQYATADVLAYPSYFEAESLGNVLLEAMMFSLPAVATVWRGLAEVVVDGETGFLVQVHDVPALSDRLERLLTDAALRGAMGKAGRRRFLAEYTIERHIERMRAAFLEVAGFGAGGSSGESGLKSSGRGADPSS